MDATIGKFVDSVSGFFSGVASGSADEFPLCDTDIISVSFMIRLFFVPQIDRLWTSRLRLSNCLTPLWIYFLRISILLRLLVRVHKVILCVWVEFWHTCKALFILWNHSQGCEKELAEAQKGEDEGFKKECIMRLSWALVHSKIPFDIQRGIAMLEGK